MASALALLACALLLATATASDLLQEPTYCEVGSTSSLVCPCYPCNAPSYRALGINGFLCVLPVISSTSPVTSTCGYMQLLRGTLDPHAPLHGSGARVAYISMSLRGLTPMQISGQIEDSPCNAETVESINRRIFPTLQALVKTDFFKYYKVRSVRSCVWRASPLSLVLCLYLPLC